jgi:hypothetical protein
MSRLKAGDRVCASCGGINDHHRSHCASDNPVKVISVYTRKQAIADGVLVDCSQPPMGELCCQLLKWPLAMTTTVFNRYVWPTAMEANLPPGQSLEGRLWDIVWILHAAIKGAVPCWRLSPEVLLFEFACVVADPARWPNEHVAREGVRRVTLKAVCGPGDEGEPVLTVMLPDED